ncbi:hypothetical protein Dsin_004093 [Dipteronia sinensis]|uniref:RRM domain-containing protein n=1 Tax=Dipteronia sinensis TaxID=43782 RepID=A0AAE0BAD9_9ROSI|nr:hypothetical protein Dsin_004093 [Dipteronia sinensis]
MPSSLDMSLDDIIRKNSRSEAHNRHFRGGRTAFVSRSGPGPDRRFPNRDPIRTRPYPVVPARKFLDAMKPMQVKPGRVTWQKQMMPSGEINRESEAKLYISNLDYDVSNDDIKLLFSEVGELIRYSIHYDKSGRSKGTAEVIYSSQANALAAIRRYNNMNLDGKPIKIELVGESVIANNACISELVRFHGNDARDIGAPGFGGGRESAIVHGNDARGIGVRGTGGGRESTRVHKPGNQNHPGKKLTAQDLDAELEKYHSEAKRIK